MSGARRSEIEERGSAVLAEVRAAVERAEANVELHIERDVYEPGTARAVAQEYREQLGGLLLPGAGVFSEEPDL